MEAASRIVGVDVFDDPFYEETGRRVGLTAEQVLKVCNMNDAEEGERHHTFSEIAGRSGDMADNQCFGHNITEVPGIT